MKVFDLAVQVWWAGRWGGGDWGLVTVRVMFVFCIFHIVKISNKKTLFKKNVCPMIMEFGSTENKVTCLGGLSELQASLVLNSHS